MASFLRQIPCLLTRNQSSQIAVKRISIASSYCTGVTLKHRQAFKTSTNITSISVVPSSIRLPSFNSFRLLSSEQSVEKNVEDRVMSCLKLYDKIKPELLTVDCSFIKDLGLDSLDHVEIIVAIENEFALEIPDTIAESLSTPRKIVEYVTKNTENSFDDRVKDLGLGQNPDPGVF